MKAIPIISLMKASVPLAADLKNVRTLLEDEAFAERVLLQRNVFFHWRAEAKFAHAPAWPSPLALSLPVPSAGLRASSFLQVAFERENLYARPSPPAVPAVAVVGGRSHPLSQPGGVQCALGLRRSDALRLGRFSSRGPEFGPTPPQIQEIPIGNLASSGIAGPPRKQRPGNSRICWIFGPAGLSGICGISGPKCRTSLEFVTHQTASIPGSTLGKRLIRPNRRAGSCGLE